MISMMQVEVPNFWLWSQGIIRPCKRESCWFEYHLEHEIIDVSVLADEVINKEGGLETCRVDQGNNYWGVKGGDCW